MKSILVTFGAATLLAALVCVSVSTAGPGVHRVSGGGTVEYAGTLNTHAFTAQIDADGNVKGQAEFQLRYVNATIHAEVNCLTVVDNDAWIGGTITRSSNPAVVGPGLGILFQVHDGGEGDAPQPDMTSPLVWGAVPSCNTTPPLGLIEWTNGNVQVKSQPGLFPRRFFEDQPVAGSSEGRLGPSPPWIGNPAFPFRAFHDGSDFAVDHLRVEPRRASPRQQSSWGEVKARYR
ncbi:MAG TPA: hypothetical protein VGK89_13565 [Candidatus Eisenbacteria bacterium]